jgi:hypothetical protein
MIAAASIAPNFTTPMLSAEQVSRILARPRPTITGWIHRYRWLGIEPVVSGSPRRFSMRDIGYLCAMRLAISAGNLSEALEQNIGDVGDAIAEAYEQLAGTLRMEDFGKSEPRPGLAKIDPPLKLIVSELFGEAKTLGVSRAFTPGGGSIADHPTARSSATSCLDARFVGPQRHRA